VSAHLVGRHAELAVLDEALAEIRTMVRPSLRLLEIVGEPGIGKSRLLTELRLRASALAVRVGAGQAAEYQTVLPFEVFVEALDDLVAGLEHAELCHRPWTPVPAVRRCLPRPARHLANRSAGRPTVACE
jgi:predicted ATPase